MSCKLPRSMIFLTFFTFIHFLVPSMMYVGVNVCWQSWQSHIETATSSLITQKQAATDTMQKHASATQVIGLSRVTFDYSLMLLSDTDAWLSVFSAVNTPYMCWVPCSGSQAGSSNMGQDFGGFGESQIGSHTIDLCSCFCSYSCCSYC